MSAPEEIVIPAPLPSGQYGLLFSVDEPATLQNLGIKIRNVSNQPLMVDIYGFDVRANYSTIVSIKEKTQRKLLPNETIIVTGPGNYSGEQFKVESAVFSYDLTVFYNVENGTERFIHS